MARFLRGKAKYRRRARELVLQVLYAWELHNCTGIESIIEEMVNRPTVPVPSRIYARRLIKLVIDHLPKIDKIIATVSHNWDITRLAIVDKNILRWAIAEMLYVEDIPPKVSIDEALEVTKKYSSDDARRFVNGVLDAVYKGILLRETLSAPDEYEAGDTE